MVPEPRVIIVEDRPGRFTGDRIVRYNDGSAEYIECGGHPKKMPSSPWATNYPVVLNLPPPLVQNREMKRAKKFGKKLVGEKPWQNAKSARYPQGRRSA